MLESVVVKMDPAKKRKAVASPAARACWRNDPIKGKLLLTDSDIVLGRLELPESNVDGDTTLTLGLELVEHPCVLEGALAKLGGFL